MIMVKPGLAYLDIIRDMKEKVYFYLYQYFLMTSAF